MAKTYTVKAGDYLGKIAKMFGVGTDKVTGYKSGNANLIRPGEVLTINDGSADTPPRTTVESGSSVEMTKSNEATPSEIEQKKSSRDSLISSYSQSRKDQLLSALDELGADRAKRKVSRTDDAISKEREMLIDGIEKLSDNPYSSAGMLGGRTAKAQEIADARIGNLNLERQGYADDYKSILDRALLYAGYGQDQDALQLNAFNTDITDLGNKELASNKALADALEADKNRAHDLVLSDKSFAQQLQLLNTRAGIDAAAEAAKNPAAKNSPEDTLAQIAFVKGSIANAMQYAKGSGAGKAEQFFADTFQGADSDYVKLRGLTDSIRSNILTAMVDPSIKKFFGPQMTNRDVELMTSGGSTLNPETQTPEMMRAELARVLDLYNRMETSVRQGLGVSATAPSVPQYKPGGEEYMLNGILYRELTDGSFEAAN